MTVVPVPISAGFHETHIPNPDGQTLHRVQRATVYTSMLAPMMAQAQYLDMLTGGWVDSGSLITIAGSNIYVDVAPSIDTTKHQWRVVVVGE